MRVRIINAHLSPHVLEIFEVLYVLRKFLSARFYARVLTRFTEKAPKEFVSILPRTHPHDIQRLARRTFSIWITIEVCVVECVVKLFDDLIPRLLLNAPTLFVRKVPHRRLLYQARRSVPRARSRG